jgi:hypothetical protein
MERAHRGVPGAAAALGCRPCVRFAGILPVAFALLNTSLSATM